MLEKNTATGTATVLGVVPVVNNPFDTVLGVLYGGYTQARTYWMVDINQLRLH